MSTGTVQSAAAIVITDMNSDALQKSFVNGSGAALTPGQEVIMKTDGTIDKRDAGSEKPIGIVVVGGVDGARVTVRLFATVIIKAKAIGGAIEEGSWCIPNGNKNSTTYVPEYTAASATNYSSALCIKGAVENGEILLAIMPPTTLPA